MGTCQDKDSPRTAEWTADGRYFITAALRPRRTVDNGFKVWTYYGTILYQRKYDKLYQVIIQPAVEGVYPDRPQSPHLTDKRNKQENEKRLDAGKPKVYVPPSLRKLGVGPSKIMKQAEEGPRSLSELEKTIATGVSPGGIRLVPGQAKSKQPSAKAQKRRKQKAKKEEDVKKEEAAEKEKKIAKSAQPAVDLSDKDAVSKRVKALKKKLRQVEQLREKEQSGEELDEAQQEKLTHETSLKEEIDSLEKALK